MTRDLWEDARLHVNLRYGDGAIRYDSAFARRWKADGGDVDRLLDLVADHADDADDDMPIDWRAVEKEYEGR